MSATVNKNGILRNRWDKWLKQYKSSIRDVAAQAGLDHTTLARAINAGVATEPIRTALVAAKIPSHLIPLPNCTSYLAGVIYEGQEAGASPKI